MPTSYTPFIGLALPVTGELSGTWGDTVNDYISKYVDAAVAGTQTISGSQTAVTLTTTNGGALITADVGATGSAQYAIINCTGNPGGLLTVTAPAASKVYLVLNNTSTNQSVKVVGAGPTTGVTVAAAQAALIAWNGSDFELVASTDASKLTGILATANGGTGLSTFGAANRALYSTSASALTAGTLPVAAGGTGATTLTGYVKGSGTTALTAAASVPVADISGTLPVSKGGTGLATLPAASIPVVNSLDTLTTVVAGANQSIRRNSGNTAWEAYTPSASTGDVTAAGNNAFTGANTFYNATGQTFGTATATQDGIILAGRAGGTNSFRVTIAPTTLTGNRNVVFPDASVSFPNTPGTVVIDTATQTLTNKTFGSSTVFLSTTTTTQDGIAIAGNNSGTNSFRISLSPATLTSSRNVIFPDIGGTISLIDASQTISGIKTFTAANSFQNATGQTFLASTTTAQDGVIITGRAGGTGSFRVTLSPGTLTASRSVTFPDGAGSVAVSGVSTNFTAPQRPSLAAETAPTTNALTWDLTTNTIMRVNLNANITTLTLTGTLSTYAGYQYQMIVRYNGGTSITWPASVKWPGGTAPTLTGTSGKVDVFNFVVASNDGGTTFFLLSTGSSQNL